jgi:transketolase
MRKQFTQTLQSLLYENSRTTLLLGDIGVFGFRNELKNIPDRVYNIGILEQASIGIAAGLSKSGLIPFVHTIAPFLIERAFEQLKIDFGYQNINGNFISVGASYDYAALGGTHHCCADVSLLGTIPNMQIIVPGTSSEFDTLIRASYNNNSPSYFRLSEYENETPQNVSFGKGIVIKKGSKATVICYGNMLSTITKACENLDVTILYYTTIIPFDSELLQHNFNKKIIICEQFYKGSTNHLISESLEGLHDFTLYNIGIPRSFLTNYGTKHQHDVNLGLTSEEIYAKLIKCIN